MQNHELLPFTLGWLQEIITRSGVVDEPFCPCRFCEHRDRSVPIKPRGITECPDFKFRSSGDKREDERRVIAAATKLAA